MPLLYVRNQNTTWGNDETMIWFQQSGSRFCVPNQQGIGYLFYYAQQQTHGLANVLEAKFSKETIVVSSGAIFLW